MDLIPVSRHRSCVRDSTAQPFTGRNPTTRGRHGGTVAESRHGGQLVSSTRGAENTELAKSGSARRRPVVTLRSRRAPEGRRCSNPRTVRSEGSRRCARPGTDRGRGGQAGRHNSRVPPAVARGLRSGVDALSDRTTAVRLLDPPLDALLPTSHRPMGALPPARIHAPARRAAHGDRPGPDLHLLGLIQRAGCSSAHVPARRGLATTARWSPKTSTTARALNLWSQGEDCAFALQ
jgi:hypothetical protein